MRATLARSPLPCRCCGCGGASTAAAAAAAVRWTAPAVAAARARLVPHAAAARVACSSRHRRNAAAAAAAADHPSAAAAPPPPAAAPPAAPLPPLIELMEDRGARLTTAAQMAWAQVLRPGDAAVDATAGNGHDTLALAQLVGPSGRVWAFDVQEAALASTRARLDAARAAAAAAQAAAASQTAAAAAPLADDVTLVHACHSRMQEFAGSCAAKVVAFNLGYLPAGGDKSVATRANTTLLALEAALEVLVPGGLLTVVAYTGHPGGREEYEAAAALLAGLSPAHFVTSETRLVNRPTAPLLLMAYRRSDAALG